MGVSENSVPLNPMVLLIIIPMKNCYFIGNIPNIFRQTHIYIYMVIDIGEAIAARIWLKPLMKLSGWWFGTFLFFNMLGMSSSQLTKSYFSEG